MNNQMFQLRLVFAEAAVTNMVLARGVQCAPLLFAAGDRAGALPPEKTNN